MELTITEYEVRGEHGTVTIRKGRVEDVWEVVAFGYGSTWRTDEDAAKAVAEEVCQLLDRLHALDEETTETTELLRNLLAGKDQGVLVPGATENGDG